MIFGWIVLSVAFILSLVSAYYSVLGLVSIFAAATVPVIVMGASLEIGKVTAAIWLHKNWHRSPWQYKSYLVPAVVFLMLLTSMGVFGFLSKAHLDQGVPTGDIAAQISLFDEKIKISRENIDANRKALKQMDDAVDQIMGRSTDEKGADKSVAVRRSQQKERTRLLSEIEGEQKKIAQLNEERAPVASQFRKVEAEVGPIKYVAALLYGDNPDQNVLEKAVRWVIILIVIVFDPLAIVLILAGQRQLEWAREDKAREESYEPDDGPLTDQQIEQIQESVADELPTGNVIVTSSIINDDPIEYERDFFANTSSITQQLDSGAYVDDDEPNTVPNVEVASEDITSHAILDEIIDITLPPPEPEVIVETPKKVPLVVPPATMEKPPKPVIIVPVTNDTRANKRSTIAADNDPLPDTEVNAQFGITFPASPNKGDLFLRVDSLPTRLFKYNGSKWMEIDKATTDTYSYNEEYIQYLIEKVSSGQYDPEDLSPSERDQIAEFIAKNAK